MMQVRQLDQTKWEKLAAKHPEANFLQSWQWGDVHAALGDVVIREGFYVDATLVGGMEAIVKDARRGRYLEVPGGPLIDWTNQELIRQVATHLHELARVHRCVFVRIRPQVSDSGAVRRDLAQAGFRIAPMHLHAEHTNILSLEPSEDELLKHMRQQTRYEVRKAQKLAIEVTQTQGEAAIQEFIAVQKTTAERQGFVPSPPAFLTALGEHFAGLHLYKATQNDQLLNLAIVLHYGEEADYFEAASTPESRRLPGAYAISWHAMCDAKRVGLKRYNFWGIAYSSDPHHRYAGVTTFKRGFGGEDVTYVPAHDLVIRPTAYLKNWLIETIRKKQRNL